MKRILLGLFASLLISIHVPYGLAQRPSSLRHSESSSSESSKAERCNATREELAALEKKAVKFSSDSPQKSRFQAKIEAFRKAVKKNCQDGQASDRNVPEASGKPHSKSVR